MRSSLSLLDFLLRRASFRSRIYETGHGQPLPETRGRPGLSVVVAAHNEGHLLRDCLGSVASIATEIVVVDVESDDDTEAVAREFTDHVIPTRNRLMVEANKSLGIERATCEWILILDPDERISRDLRDQIDQVVTGPHSQFAGYFMPRRNYELGRWIRAIGHYPGVQLRLVRNGAGAYSLDALHQHLQVRGPVGLLTGVMVHLPPQSLRYYAEKRNLYSEHEAARRMDRRQPFRAVNLIIAPVREFLRQYVMLGGWLEGVPGFLIAANGAWSKLLVHGKLWQLWEDERRSRP
jgi:glycosyltransferase involved in cell wall biosynthesis